MIKRPGEKMQEDQVWQNNCGPIVETGVLTVKQELFENLVLARGRRFNADLKFTPLKISGSGFSLF